MNAVRAGLVLVAAAVVAAVAWVSLSGEEPELVVGDTVAGDLAALAETTHARFVVAAPAAAGCMGSLRLEAAYELDDAAVYDQTAGIVFVRVPATAPSLEHSLVHEFAHHLELVCDEHLSFRPAFLAAQGHAPTTPWFGGTAWEERPSEQFAEAVAQVVLGDRSRNRLRIRLAPETLLLVEAWLTTGG